ncbi:MAG: Gfo/Idh/MocA family oxidoreductase [Planctomycetaceae bacterium]|nr:Gfo/Idh/MocA family oxidoreductase [Planctomycetaceae bacterium]
MKRREFIKTAAAAAGSLSIPLFVKAETKGANEKINIAHIGCGGRGTALMSGFPYADTTIKGFQDFDVNILWCCDPRKERANNAVKIADAKSPAAKPTYEMREVLDDKAVDAVVCALPDHWHALAAIMACQAGKDVYTEKPASHSAWEGQKMVDAARKYKRVVQHGTQNRSAPYNIAAKKYIEEGKLGRIHFCKVFNMKEWKNFKLAPTAPVPENVDWNHWLGPAPERAFSPSYFGSWHHIWDFSSGDMINDGIHQLDLARWLIGKDLPKSAYCVGGRFDSTGDAETPDTQITTWEYDDLTMTFDLTLYTPYMLKTDAVVRQSDMFPLWAQNATRIEIYGSEGMMIVGRHGGGWQVYIRPKDRLPVVKDFAHGRFPDDEHKENFLQCIKTRAFPNSDIETGHRSTLLGHYATISYRLGGQKLNINTKDGTIIDCPEAAKYFKRTYRRPFEVPEEV